MTEVAGPASPVEVGVVDVNLAVSTESALGLVEPAAEETASKNAAVAEASPESKETEEAHEEVRDQPTPSVSPVHSPESSPTKVAASGTTKPSAEVADFSSPPDRRFVSYNRGRVVSLDRGHELRRVVSLDRGRELLAEMEGANSSSDLSNAAEEFAGAHSNNDDEDSLGSNSSDGESSYFAKHLPSPKSGRRWSYSDTASTSSAPARAGPYGNSNNGWKTDTSLSFSDDEEDDHPRPGMRIITSRTSPMLPPPVPREGSEELPPYPQRITRIHSMNSLVSSSSDGEGRAQETPLPPLRNSSHGSLSSVGDGSDSTSSDPSVRAELRHVAVPKTQRSSSAGNSQQMSGRMPPFSGAHYPPSFMGGYMHTPPVVPQGSPPPIYNQGQLPPNAQDVAHPQPMTQEQMASWLAAGNHMPPPPFIPPPFFPPPGYGATAVMPNPETMQPHLVRPSSDAMNSSAHSTESGNMTLNMVYSDDDADDAHFGHKAALHAGAADYRGNARGVSYDSRMSSNSALDGDNVVADSHDLLGMGAYGHQAALKAPGGSQDPLSSGGESGREVSSPDKGGFKVYVQRWLMLFYMSILNLLSDWTCYSVAPISLLTSEAFGKINPEQLVVVFLGANAVATACEPIILSRLGLRRTVLVGAFLLMLGSIVKSGGLPPIVQPTLTKGQGEWRVYLGFFLVGLSQPLYQCTPALLSASWFPESERTMATGVALNANQLGIGFAFIFGTLLVADSDDIVRYFGLLSFISTVTFLGCLVQFDDAPPTPPSDTARAIRGTFQPKMHPAVDSIWKSVRSFASQRDIGVVDDDDDDPSQRSPRDRSDSNHSGSRKSVSSSGQRSKSSRSGDGQRRRRRSESGRSGRKSRRSSSRSKTSNESPRPSSRKQAQPAGSTAAATGTSTRRRSTANRKRTASSENGLIPAPALAPPPSPASTRRPTQAAMEIAAFEYEAYSAAVIPPSHMMPGPVGPPPSTGRSEDDSFLNVSESYSGDQANQIPSATNETPEDHGLPQPDQYAQFPATSMPMGYQQHPQWQQQQAYWDPRYQQAHFQHPAYHQQYQGYYQQQGFQQHGYYAYPPGYYPQMYPQYNPYNYQQGDISYVSELDEGAEPTVTVTDHHLDIHIRDDQIILSTRACLSRPGFIHALVSFTVSGIVINTLSTFMDYLVRLNGAGREYTGIVGGTFQFVIMISSLIVGKQTDRTRAYYSVILAMLVLGAFGLAECGVSLDADRGSNLRWMLIVVAALVGPLQPVSTELGVDVAYPLSENTVLVIQQLFSNLLSAMFIPFFKALKDVGTAEDTNDEDLVERPEYTFSFYLLIVLHAMATVFFATFNGRYLRYEQEMQKKAQEEAKTMFAGPTAFHPVQDFDSMQPPGPYQVYDEAAHHGNETQPLMNKVV